MPADKGRPDHEALSEASVREQLQRLLASRQLVHSQGLSRLLSFIVDETLEGRGDELKEVRLGLEVFDRRPGSYDPTVDPIVRVQAGRLRAKLRAYYESQGVGDKVLIEVPRGGYVASFRTRAAVPRAPAAPVHPAVPGEPRLAVLPFVNMSPDPENEYFSDGLTEELINTLAREGSLQVVARTSSFQFKGEGRDVRDIGRQLGVGMVLEGSVRRSDDRVRVTAQLINVSDGCHLWSERYEREIVEIFAIQDEISAAIAGALRSYFADARPDRPRPGPRRTPTRQIDAYNHYLQGRFHWNRRTEPGLRAGIEHFAEAIRLDPAYARAYSGRADCHLMLGMSATEAPDRCMGEARTAARRALELDEGLAEAHASLSAVKSCYEWDHPGAEVEYRRALALDPSYATAHHWHGFFGLAPSGRLAEAVEELEWAMELDPLSPPIAADLGLVHCFRQDLDAAVAQSRRAQKLDPHFHRPYWVKGLALSGRGDLSAAEEALRKGLELCPGHAFRTRMMGTLGSVVWLTPMLGFDYPNGKVKIYGEGNNKISWVSYRDVARIAVGALDQPKARNKILPVGGPEALSPREVVKIFEASGAAEITEEHLSEADLVSQMRSASDPLAESFAALMLQYARGNVMDMTETLELFPFPLTSVRDYVSKQRAA